MLNERLTMNSERQNREMNIAIILEENYIDYAKVMLHTLFYHHLKRKMTVYIFTTGLSRTYQRQIKKIASGYQKRIVFIVVGCEVTDRFPQRGHWPKSVWNSVLIPFYLPEHVKKIIYLDVDIVVNCSLGRIYDMELGENCMAACEDLWVKRHRRGIGWRLQIFDEDFKYFNLGVNLIDVEKLRQRFPETIEKVEEFCVANSDRMEFIDQDFYNIFCHGAVKYLNPNKYDYVRDVYFPPLHKGKVVENNAAVIHYASNKPLNPEALDLYGVIFWKYAFRFGLAKEIFKGMRENYLKEQGKKEFYGSLCKSVKTIVSERWKKKNDEMTDKLNVNYQVLLNWLDFVLSGKNISSYMQMHKFQNLAVYGAGPVGKAFIDYVLREQCEVAFILDKKVSGEYNGIEIRKNIEPQNHVDVIVVTAEYYFEEIEDELKTKTRSHITSISQIIYEVG